MHRSHIDESTCSGHEYGLVEHVHHASSPGRLLWAYVSCMYVKRCTHTDVSCRTVFRRPSPRELYDYAEVHNRNGGDLIGTVQCVGTGVGCTVALL